MWRRFKVTEDEDKHSRKVIASCVRAGAATSSRTERRNMEQKCWIYTTYICIFSISITFPPACLPVPAYLQYVRKLFHWKRHIFPLSLLPPRPKRKNENKTVSRPPAKPDFDPYSYDTTTVISKTFWMKSYTMMQHEIVPKLLKTFL